MGILIGMESVSHEWPGKRVLVDQTIAVNEGDRIGIVGRNGDGKTTVLDVIAGRVVPDAGRVIMRGGTSLGILAQGDDLSDDADVIHAIVGDLPEYEWAASPRIRSILDALLEGIDRSSLVGTLSGGQRRRVDLARVLVGTWDVLLLDEPTNHLDLRAITWLAEHLKARWADGSGALLVVTHDRWFLDEVCLGMWEVHDGRIEPFEGGYSAYIQQRVERERQAAVAETRRRNVLRKELAWLARGAQARSTKPKFRVEEARALVADVPPMRNPLELKRLAMSRLGRQVIEMEGVRASYVDDEGTNEVITGIDWLVGPGERIGILGENGAGKTTLLGLMTGRLKPTSGTVRIGQSVRFGILDQRLVALAPYETWRVSELLAHQRRHFVIDGKPMTPEKMLENLGFEKRELSTRICDLSGGQRRRLAIMCVLIDEPNVLVLDEPGNDLDTDMLAVLEDLLDEWPGTLLLVTHDRSLMERVTDSQYALIDGTIRHVPGGVDEYLRLLADKEVAGPLSDLRATRSRPDRGPSDLMTPSRQSPSRDDGSGSTARGEDGEPILSNKERREAAKRFAAVSRMLERRSGAPDEVRARLAAHDPTDYEGLLALQAELDETVASIDALELEWLELSELLGE
ncbi:MAG: ABC-F family ATP-binding cassette domain-containing protein [Atopobiaceae bacterium]|nr:ABC-F family ATP-binding cassette domain-containing protein [Atopobiaceae bacterium]